MYHSLLKTAQDMDTLLSTAILVSFTCNFLQTCTCLVQLNNEKTTYVFIFKIILIFFNNGYIFQSVDRLGTDYYRFWFILLVVRTSAVIHYAASINDQYKRIKVVLHSVINLNDDSEVIINVAFK